MAGPGPVDRAQPTPDPTGAPPSAPVALPGGSERVPPSGLSGLQELDLYRMMLRAGASPLGALTAILKEELHPAYRVAILAALQPGRLSPMVLREVLRRYAIHPLSLALQFQDRRRALRILQHLDLRTNYAPWIGPGGRLVIQGDRGLRRLPGGLVLRGDSLISDCPHLVNLGPGLTSLFGQIRIERCPVLRRLPSGLETHYLGDILVIDCPAFEGLGARNTIRGRLEVHGCPRFKLITDQGDSHVESVSKHRT